MTSGIPTANSQGFSVSPEDAPVKIYAALGEFQDQVGEKLRHLNVLGRMAPLGDGYAKEISEYISKQVVGDEELAKGVASAGSTKEALVAVGRELEKRRQAIKKALEDYQAQDQNAVEGVDCIGG